MPHSAFVSELLFGIEPFYILTYLIAGTVAASGIAWKFIRMLQKIDTRGKNHNKAFCELARHADSETQRLHPDRSQNKIKPTIENILKE